MALFHILRSSFQFEVGLLFDAPERSNWNVGLRMRDSDAAKFGWMLELKMAALLGNLLPTSDFRAFIMSCDLIVYLYTLTYSLSSV
jgi:hypothetical protein